MNKTAIKNFAVSARKKLKAAVAQKAYDIGVFEDKISPVDEVTGGYIYNGKSFSKTELTGRKKLIATINLLSEEKGYKHGYELVIEEVAYTWFNRLIALRFMEVNGYLPSNIRILSSVDTERVEPDCIREVESLDFVDMAMVSELASDTEKLYRYILTKQCNALADIMPRMFEKLHDYTEMLLPDRLYIREGEIIYNLVHSIDEVDFTEQVEIIGWLYQYYISEKKDEVFAGLKKNVKITKENIPAATQLFTPDWIVKYMVENSIGRLAVEKLDMSPTEMGWKYYLPEAEQTEEVKQQLAIINGNKKNFDIKDLKIVDPCMGSGHILVYAFDVLVQIYEKLGYNGREIPNLILENNIYGLDIDKRAGQLSYFALLMKARSHNRRFFRQENIPQPKVYSFIESDGIKIAEDMLKDKDLQEGLNHLLTLFLDAKEYGSIMKIEKVIDYKELIKYVSEYEPTELTTENMGFEEDKERLVNILEIADTLTQKYDVVITNPPYMGGSGMGATLSGYVKKNFADSKSDLFAVFIEKCGQMLNPNGIQAMITQHSFMFLSSYEKLRGKLLLKDIVNMAHLGARAFEEIGGEVVQTTAFVLRNSDIKGYQSTFVRLVDFNSQQAKEVAFLTGENRHIAVKENFEKIPGSPVAYWVNEKIFLTYDNLPLSKYVDCKSGIMTGSDNFIKSWYEVSIMKIKFDCKSAMDMKSYKWFPLNSGGDYRNWFGNNIKIVNLYNNGENIKAIVKNYRLRDSEYYFKEGITWGRITTSKITFREVQEGSLFGDAGPIAFVSKYKKYILGFLCSKVASIMLNITNPTLNFQVHDIMNIPLMIEQVEKVEDIVKSNICLAKTDWNSFETSWDFQTHPLIHFKTPEEILGIGVKDYFREKIRISSSGEPVQDYDMGQELEEKIYIGFNIGTTFKQCEKFTEQQFTQLKQNEEELNRIFIEIYGLQDELTPEVEDKDVTIRKADLVRDIKSFISYAVGCMFGRYSLDVDGLVFAGCEWDNTKYKTFIPDESNILPINDNDYFDNDIVVRFVEFVKVVYGEETLEENLAFIANALYPNANGTDRERIRRYFMNDFYKDHVKTYHKKPIYWQFDSGKQNGFKCLIYLHRYDKYTPARVRTDYLHPLQRKYDAEIKQILMHSDMTENPREKAEYRKQIDKIEKQLAECRAYEPSLAHIAHQTIELDLDDGVTVNYGKFMGIDVGEGNKVDLLGKI